MFQMEETYHAYLTKLFGGFSTFMRLGIFPSQTSKPNNHGRRLNIFHTLFLKFVPCKEQAYGERNFHPQPITTDDDLGLACQTLERDNERVT